MKGTENSTQVKRKINYACTSQNIFVILEKVLEMRGSRAGDRAPYIDLLSKIEEMQSLLLEAPRN